MLGKLMAQWKYVWRPRVVGWLDRCAAGVTTKLADRVAAQDPAQRIVSAARERQQRSEREVWLDGWDSGVKIALATLRGEEEDRSRLEQEMGGDGVVSVYAPGVEGALQLHRRSLEGWVR